MQARLIQLLETIHHHQIAVFQCQKVTNKIFIIYCQVSKEEYCLDHFKWLWKLYKVKMDKEFGCHFMKFTIKKYMIFTISKVQAHWTLDSQSMAKYPYQIWSQSRSHVSKKLFIILWLDLKIDPPDRLMPMLRVLDHILSSKFH